MSSSTSASVASVSRPDFVPVCPLELIPPEAGVCARVAGVAVAIFRVGDAVYAIGDRDPFTGARVLSRGIVGDKRGVLQVSSPLHRHSFALETGACLDDPAVSVPVFRVRVRAGIVEVAP